MRRGLTILVVVILLTGAAAGLIIWNNNKNKTPSATLPPASQNSAKYMAIKEWGVRFQLPAAYADDITYYYDSSNDSVSFGSKKYAAIEPLCAANQTGFSWGLFRYKHGQEDRPPPSSAYKFLGGYDYVYTPGGSGCNANSKLTSSQLMDLSNEKYSLTSAIQNTLQF